MKGLEFIYILYVIFSRTFMLLLVQNDLFLTPPSPNNTKHILPMPGLEFI